MKQSKTNYQTGKGAQIKGSNYNFSGVLIINLQKHPRTKSEISFKVAKRCRFTEHCSLSLRAAGRETLQQRRRWFASINGACFMADISRHHDARRPLLCPCNNKWKRLHPLAIKARGCTEQKEKKKGTRQRKEKTEGEGNVKKRKQREEERKKLKKSSKRRKQREENRGEQTGKERKRERERERRVNEKKNRGTH